MAKRVGVMLANRYEGEKSMRKWPKSFLVQPKYDGMRCRAVPDADANVTLLSSQGNAIVSVPHINDAMSRLYRAAKIPLDVELDGELYSSMLPFEEIMSICKRTNGLHADYRAISFHVFDLVSNETQWDRTRKLLDIAMTATAQEIDEFVLVPTWAVTSLREMHDKLGELMAMGFEGIIMRNPNGCYVDKKTNNLLKLKPMLSAWFPIIGVAEEISIDGIAKSALGAVVVRTPANVDVNVGTGPWLTRQARNANWPGDKLIGATALVKYQELTALGSLRFPVLLDVRQ